MMVCDIHREGRSINNWMLLIALPVTTHACRSGLGVARIGHVHGYPGRLYHCYLTWSNRILNT